MPAGIGSTGCTHAITRVASVLSLTLVQTLQAQPTAYTVPPTPAIRIESFGDSIPIGRIVGVTTLTGAKLVVADESLMRVFVLRTDGRILASLGRTGSGPGEFRTLVMMGQCSSDTVSIYDPAQSRVSTITVAGKLVNTQSTLGVGSVGVGPSASATPYILVCGHTGVYARVSWPHVLPPKELGPHRSTVSVAVSRGLSSRNALLGTFAGPERYRFARSDGPRPYGKSIHVGVSEKRVFVGTADSFFVEIYDIDGTRRGAIRRTAPLKRFRALDKTNYLKSITPPTASSEQKQRIRTSVDALVYPEYLPAYDRFLVDRSNRLWVAETFSAGEQIRQWWAFDENGTPQASLQVPLQFEVMEFTESMVLGKWTDDDGAESVRGYRVVPVR